jgi:type I restriction enzyme S subunit
MIGGLWKDLPRAWRVEKIGTLFDVQQGKALSQATRVGINQRRFLRTANVLWGRLQLEELDRMHFDPDEVEKFSLRKCDLLVCEGGEIGRAAVWDGSDPDCLYQNHVHRLRRKNDEVVPEFVALWLQAAFLHFRIYGEIGNKTTIPNLSASRLKDLHVPLPKPREQAAISSSLRTVQKSVVMQEGRVAALRKLKTATMSKLFREGLRGELLKHADIGELPTNWEVVSVGDFCQHMNYGTSKHCTRDPSNGLPVLRIPNVINGTVDPGELKYAHLTDAERRKVELQRGDLLFVRTNGTKENVGRSAVYEDVPEKALFASYLIRARLDPEAFNPSFVNAYLLSNGRDQLSGRAHPASDGKFNLDTGTIRAVRLPRPPLDEQQEIEAVAALLDARLRAAAERLKTSHELFDAALLALMSGRVEPPVLAEAKPEN